MTPSVFDGSRYHRKKPGRTGTFACARGESTQICVRRLDRDEAAPMPGTENGRYPVFSPDGRSIVFCVASPRTYCDSTAPLKTLSTTSVRVDTLGTTPDGLRIPPIFSWTADGQILLGGRGGIWSLPASGATATALVRVDPARGELSAGFPAWLPGNRQLMFGVRRAEGEQLVDEVRVLNVASGEQRVLLRDARNPLFLPTGHLLYVHTRAESWLGVLTLGYAQVQEVPIWHGMIFQNNLLPYHPEKITLYTCYITCSKKSQHIIKTNCALRN